MLPYIITYFILGVVSAVLVYGMVYAALESKETALLESVLTVFFWPTLLLLMFVMTGFAKHGLLFKNPHKKKEDMKRDILPPYGLPVVKNDFYPREQRCAECGGMFLEEKMKSVAVSKPIPWSRYDHTEWYCKTHTVAYDKVFYGDVKRDRYWKKFFKTIPAHEVEVDQDGNEIKKKGK